MSEQLLKAVIRLFALMAGLDGVKETERNTIRLFLDSRLNRETADRFMLYFDEYVNEKPEDQETDSGLNPEINLIISISQKINTELTVQQKVFLMMELMQLMYADKVLSSKETRALEGIRDALNISAEDVVLIKNFVIGERIEDFSSSSYLIVHGPGASFPGKNRHIETEFLDGFIVVLSIGSIKPFFIRYLGKSVVYLNHVPLEYGKIEIFPTGSTFRSEKFSTIYYSDIVREFNEFISDTEVTFTAEHVSFRFGNGAFGLRDISLSEQNGHLVGIMGASGSGKSTLFNVLNGNEKPTEGKVQINGFDIHVRDAAIKSSIGYVPQDDLLIEDLTVYQNLYYAAKLCFNDYSEVQIDELVSHTLYNLGLYEARDLKVGSPLNKTISGGQRKRLNIGLELLREPLILFVDEPTSGLSSRDSENIMDLLKELTLRGKLIFVVIHQPSSDLFKMFDRLMILDVGGYPIYYGNPVDAVVYFKEAANLIDRHEGACPECGNVNPEQIFNIIEAKVVDEYGRATDQRKTTPTTWNEIYRDRFKFEKEETPSGKPDTALNIPDKLKQSLIFTARDVRAKLSNKQYMLINFLEAPLLAIILAGLVRFYPGDGLRPSAYVFQENMNIPAYIFMAVIVALFMGLTVSAEEIIKDRKILKREAFLNLSKGSYIFSKLLILFVLSGVQTLSFVLIGNVILEIKGMFVSYWLVLFSVSCFANVLGLNISSAFNSAITIYIIIPILLIPQILLSGVVVQFDQLNPTFGAKTRVPLIGDIMASRWAYEALMVTQFKDNAYGEIFYDVEKKINQAEYVITYYLPQLESMSEYIHINRSAVDEKVKETVQLNMKVLVNELHMLTDEFGADKLPGLDELSLSTYDTSAFNRTKTFLNTVRKVHLHRQKSARAERQDIIKSLTKTPAAIEEYQQMIREHTNDQVTALVLDNKETTRIMEHKGQLVQKIYPIYMTPDPRGFLDFRTQFYVPEKPFAGFYINTLAFNVIIIWFMTTLLVCALYFDVLRKIINPDRPVSRKTRK